MATAAIRSFVIVNRDTPVRLPPSLQDMHAIWACAGEARGVRVDGTKIGANTSMYTADSQGCAVEVIAQTAYAHNCESLVFAVVNYGPRR